MGGIETHLQNLCRELAKTYRVNAIVANDGPGLSRRWMDPFTSTVLASNSISPRLRFAWARARHPRPPLRLLHLHLPNPIATLRVLASGFQGPVVTTYHSDVVRQKFLGGAFEPVLQQDSEAAASAIICTSQRYLDSSPSLAAYREKCIVIPYGIPSPASTDAEPDQIAAIASALRVEA